MKTPQVPARPGMSPLGFDTQASWRKQRNGHVDPWLNPINQDQKTVAERQWRAGKLAPAPQQPCDVGLFSDDANQKELF